MRALRFLAVLLAAIAPAASQVIEFESGGLKYKTLTRNGVTIMAAPIPTHVRDYSVIQIAVSNGSQLPWMIKTEDFQYFKADGSPPLQPARPGAVVSELIDKAGRNEVIRLVGTYETGLYGLTRINSTNGYEQRRQAAMTALGSARLTAAAAASAIAFVTIKLRPGQTTDGAIFYPNHAKPLEKGKLVVHAAAEVFELPLEPHTP